MNSRYRIAVAVAGLVFALGGTSSWGQVPPTNDTSDAKDNTGGGHRALGGANLSGTFNTAYGAFSLFHNTTGDDNTAVGVEALSGNTGGSNNTAVGFDALINNGDGHDNTAVGAFALDKNTGNFNTALGSGAGVNLKNGSNNIYLGNPGGVSDANIMRLGNGQLTIVKASSLVLNGVKGKNVGSSGLQVFINSNGQLGTVVSSARYKRDIHDMGARSQGLLQLRPVTFRYKHDPQGQRQYGLIAEEVAKVYPELVTKGADGKVESVQYHELIPMLLNELQHQQQKLETQSQELAELKAQNAHLQAALVQQNAALAARLERLEEGATRTATLTHR